MLIGQLSDHPLQRFFVNNYKRYSFRISNERVSICSGLYPNKLSAT